jgi:hypothetical protein
VKEGEMGRACSTSGKKKNAYRILMGNSDRKDYSGNQDVGGWIILKHILVTMWWYGLD